MKKILLICAQLCACITGFAQLLTIDVPLHRFRIDSINHIIVVQSQNLSDYSDLSVYSEIDLALTEFEFSFVEIPDSIVHTGAYLVNNGEADYTLFFTTLALAEIITQYNIPDEPKVDAYFYYADADQILVSAIGIERRGGVSQNYPKKTYDIEFWEDVQSEIDIDVQFGNMRSDDDWVLDALYNEPLRIRSKSAHQLWLDIHDPHYLAQEPNAKSGIEVQYVELFLNGQYIGIYTLSEQIDRKLLKLKHYDEGIEGELYKGYTLGEANSYTSLPPFNNAQRVWSGYYYKYPNSEDTTDWQNLYDFTDFVINSSDSDFENVWNGFDQGNFFDYFIFINVLRAADNTAKNIYTGRYDSNSPYFYVPWDLDGVFGTKYNGTFNNVTDDIWSNNFHNRVIETNIGNYSEMISNRYFELREGLMHPDSLFERLNESYQLLKANNVYTREALIFPNYPFDQESLDITETWITERIAFLDIYFGYYLGVKDIPIPKNLVYPNPASDKIRILNSSDYINDGYAIYNIQGKTVQQGIVTSGEIDISKVTRGLYIFKVGSDAQTIILK